MILVTGGAGFDGANFVWGSLSQSNDSLINVNGLYFACNPKNLTSDGGRSGGGFKVCHVISGMFSHICSVNLIFSKISSQANRKLSFQNYLYGNNFRLDESVLGRNLKAIA